MDHRAFAAQAAPYLTTLLLAALAYLAQLAVAALRKSSASARVQRALEQLLEVTVISVERTAQVVVADLKDPSKPGTWDAVAARAARESVEADVRALARGALDTLRTEGAYSPAELATLVDRAIESAVARVKARAPSALDLTELAEPIAAAPAHTTKGGDA